MIYLYNTMSRRKELLTPFEPGHVKIYSCGPTVYRYIHIGNLRTFVMADWLKRVIKQLGLRVTHVKNITDVGHMRVERLDRGEDKLIAQARKEGRTSAEIAAFYTEAFLADETALGITRPDVLPRATDHIPEMIDIIAGLLEKGIAYSAGGNIYFHVQAFPDYGKLSGNLLSTLLEGVRDTADPYKRNPEDFALWKAAEPGRDLAWESPWGRGFPGWHIECSAMSMKYLGPQFDIHTGGVDNIFPHHEDEIAQSEGYTGKPFVQLWVHAQHLLADGLKMAKSTGNAYTRADIEARGFEPLALRYLFSQTHYRSRLNFNFSALRAAQTGLQRLRIAAQHLAQSAAKTASTESQIDTHRRAIMAALCDDLNLPRAMAQLWNMLRRDRTTPPTEKLTLLLETDQILGFGLAEWLQHHTDTEQPDASATSPQATEVLEELLRQRAALRKRGDYRAADQIREQIRLAGFHVRDTPNGALALPLQADQEFVPITRATEVVSQLETPPLYQFSINLIGRDNAADLQRCIESIARHAAETSLEIVVIDNGSTDTTVDYLRDLSRHGISDSNGQPIALQILFADHNLGFAAGRNATMRASRGQILIHLDTSIEVDGSIWAQIAAALADHSNGLVGPYGLRTVDLKEFFESEGPEVDAIEGYLMAFRRELLNEIGWLDERFRFYRLLDIHTSFFVKTAGYRVIALPALQQALIKHPHREWYSMSDEDRAARSKKNFDIYYRRWHHGQSLMAINYNPDSHWFGHDHPTHTHPAEELPPPGMPHRHPHQHWSDHAHDHWHYHHTEHTRPVGRTDNE
ncbi:MAG: hypothetical protein Fur005_04610 [Roseiflexaceae bacterium]